MGETQVTKQIAIDQITVPADIKLVNRRKILEYLMSGEKCTAADICNATGISKPTTMRALQYFCERGLLESAGLGKSTRVGGKRPEYFVFSDVRKILCIALWPYQNGVKGNGIGDLIVSFFPSCPSICCIKNQHTHIHLAT